MAGSEYWRPMWYAKANDQQQCDSVYSGRYDYTAEHRTALISDALNGLGLTKTDSLIDVGCASGFTGFALAQCVRGYIGLDYSKPALQFFGRNRKTDAGLVCGSAMSLPFKDHSFDKGYMGSVLLCLTPEECLQALTELRRVVARRAFIADTLIGWVGPCTRNNAPGCPCLHHCTAFALKEWINLIGQAGWSGYELRKMDPSLPHYSWAVDTVLWA